MKKRPKAIKDITTKLEHTEQLLQVSENKYRQLVENAECIILRIDNKGKVTFFNEFAQKFFGDDGQRILGKNIIGSILPERDNSGREILDLVRVGKRHSKRNATGENETIDKDGRRVWIAWATKAIKNGSKNFTEILCVGHDITERKHLEQQLRLSAAVVHTSNDAIIILDLAGNIISWNLGAEGIYGYREAEAKQMHINQIIPDYKQNEMRLLMEKVLAGKDVKSFGTQRLTKNNRILDISLTATWLKDEAGVPFAITVTERDITERRLLEKEILDITERERERIGQEIHDGMGQTLTGITVMSKGLMLKLKKTAAEEAKTALTISKLASQAITQTRELAKMLYPVDLETGGLVSALKTLAANAEKTMGLKCRFRCGKAVAVKNLVEAKQIYRIVQEAITNAVRHGMAKQVNIKLHLAKPGTILTVESDGLDFPKLSAQQRGVGLKIMQYRTDLIGGSLEIHKGDRGGTLLRCIFPNGR